MQLFDINDIEQVACASVHADVCAPAPLVMAHMQAVTHSGTELGVSR